jgi:hypothetical protein
VLDELGSADAFPDQPVGLYARGPTASLAAMYALALAEAARPERCSRLKWYVLRDGFLSYRAFFERPRSLRDSFRLLPADRDRTTGYDREIPASFFVFDVLRSWDLPQLLAAAPAEGLIVNPVSGDWSRLAEPAARRLLPTRVRVVCHSEPETAITAFLQEVSR